MKSQEAGWMETVESAFDRLPPEAVAQVLRLLPLHVRCGCLALSKTVCAAGTDFPEVWSSCRFEPLLPNLSNFELARTTRRASGLLRELILAGPAELAAPALTAAGLCDVLCSNRGIHHLAVAGCSGIDKGALLSALAMASGRGALASLHAVEIGGLKPPAGPVGRFGPLASEQEKERRLLRRLLPPGCKLQADTCRVCGELGPSESCDFCHHLVCTSCCARCACGRRLCRQCRALPISASSRCLCCEKDVCLHCAAGAAAVAELAAGTGTRPAHAPDCAGCQSELCAACYRRAVRCDVCEFECDAAASAPRRAFADGCLACRRIRASEACRAPFGPRSAAGRAGRWGGGPGLAECRECGVRACAVCASGALLFRACPVCSRAHCDGCHRAVMGEPPAGTARRSLCAGCERSFGCAHCAAQAGSCASCAAQFCRRCARRGGGVLHDCRVAGCGARTCDECAVRLGGESGSAGQRCYDCALACAGE
jgi:hypothetical protein